MVWFCDSLGFVTGFDPIPVRKVENKAFSLIFPVVQVFICQAFNAGNHTFNLST
jgi:hypothetical protein